MPRYAICFDFPEMNGEPVFAGWLNGMLQFAPRLETAAKFDTEEIAERWLNNNWSSPEIKGYGTVVEVGE